jgi:biotin-(acetyl-CoA carboxylase) ligase
MNNFSDYTREELEKAHYNVLSMLEEKDKKIVKLQQEIDDIKEKHQNKLDSIKREKIKKQKQKEEASRVLQEDVFEGFEEVSLSDVAKYYKLTEIMKSEINAQKNRNRIVKGYWEEIVTDLNLALSSALSEGKDKLKLVLSDKQIAVIDNWAARNKIIEVREH